MFRRTYEDFTERVPRDDVHTVLECNPGICAGGDMDFGGLPYERWAAGDPYVPGTEMRQFVCPAWWYQIADHERMPDWGECSGVNRFSNCKHFPNKAACWARWDREFGESGL